MNSRKTINKKREDKDFYEHCKGQCGYTPYCTECKQEREKILKRCFEDRGFIEEPHGSHD